MLESPYARFKAELNFFSLADLLTIERYAASQSPESIFDFFMVDPRDLGQGDMRIFTLAFKRGRSRAIADASDNLFSNMVASKASGSAACLSYLKRHSRNYKEESSIDDSEGSDSTGFTYNLNITHKPNEGNTIQETKESEEKVVTLRQV